MNIKLYAEEKNNLIKNDMQMNAQKYYLWTEHFPAHGPTPIHSGQHDYKRHEHDNNL